MMDVDVRRMITEGLTLCSVNVLYVMPDHRSLVNEFFWQTLDKTPSYPRIKRFLDYWEASIEAKIKEVTICAGSPLKPTGWTSPTFIIGT